MLDFYRLNKYHVRMLPYVFEKLASLQEGDAHLLDKTMIIDGSPMADGNRHNHRRAPLFVAGGANGQWEGEGNREAAEGRPRGNGMGKRKDKGGRAGKHN